MSSRTEPHGARYVYEMIKGKAVLKVAPGLARTPQGQGLFLILLVSMVSIGGVAIGYYIDTGIIHRPLDVFGVCNPPATLQNVGGFYAGIGSHVSCVTSVVQNINVNGQPQQVVVQAPAGDFYYFNGTKATP